MEPGGGSEIKDSSTWDMANLEQLLSQPQSQSQSQRQTQYQSHIQEDLTELAYISSPIHTGFLKEEAIEMISTLLSRHEMGGGIVRDESIMVNQPLISTSLIDTERDDAEVFSTNNLVDVEDLMIDSTETPLSANLPTIFTVETRLEDVGDVDVINVRGEISTVVEAKSEDVIAVHGKDEEMVDTTPPISVTPSMVEKKLGKDTDCNVLDATTVISTGVSDQRKEADPIAIVNAIPISTNFSQNIEKEVTMAEIFSEQTLDSPILEGIPISETKGKEKTIDSIGVSDKKEENRLALVVAPVSLKVPRKRKRKTLSEDIMKNWIEKCVERKDGRIDKTYKHKTLNFTCRSLVEVKIYETNGIRPQRRKKLQMENQSLSPPLRILDFEHGEKSTCQADAEDSATQTDPNCYAIATDSGGEEVEKLPANSDDDNNFYIKYREPLTTPNAEGNPMKISTNNANANASRLVEVPITFESNIDELLKDISKDDSSNFQSQVFGELEALRANFEDLKDKMSTGLASIMNFIENMSGTLQFSFQKK